ncbi:taste receptor type 1 member 1 [Pleurodeles waltl]|uniref:taste receptor type 1 member 1 n=1 Tax=Pleurodeles waltl TaxID=8319 RepID=UPI0037099793
MEPLRELTRKGVDFVWSGKQRDTFEIIKREIAVAPNLKPFNVKAQCIVTVDATAASDYMSDEFRVIEEKKWVESDQEDSILKKTGFFDDHGYHLFQAMRFAIEEVNNSSVLLPDVTLGYEIFDTCSESASVFAALNILTECTRPFVKIQNSYVEYRPKAIALIGPDSSTLTSTTASILSNFLMPQIGYESTSVKLALKNFYPSFLRTIPSDDLQVSVLLHLLIQFNWTWIAVVASDNDYGRQGLQSLYGKALNIGICVAYQGVIPDNVNANGSAVQQMLTQINQSRVQVIVVYSTRRLARGFFKVAIGENITDKVWLATEDWSGSPLITDIPNIRSIGSVIGVSVKKSVDLALKEFEVTYVNSAKAQVPPLGEGCNQVCEKCHMFIPETMPIPSVFDLRAAFNVYSAVYAVAHGLHNLLNCSTGKCNKDTVYPWQLLKKIKKVSFTIHNQSISFDDKGDPLTGYDIVMWNWNEKNVSVCVIGSYSQHPSTLSINIDELKWHTKDNTNFECVSQHLELASLLDHEPVEFLEVGCDVSSSGEASTVQGEGESGHIGGDEAGHWGSGVETTDTDGPSGTEDLYSCRPCERDQWSPPRSDACFNRTVEYLSWSDPISMILLATITIQLLVIITIAVVFVKNLDTPVVKSAGGIRCLLMLASLACACCSLYLYFGEPTPKTCLLRQPLFAVSFTVCFSCIVVRSFQIVCIFKLASKAPRLYDFWVRKNGPNIFIGVSSALQVLISIIWVSLTPPQPVADYNKFNDQILLECSESSSVGSLLEIVYIGLLSMFCFIFCYMGKDLPANYNEAKCITFSLLVYFLAWISFFTTYLVYKGKYITAVNVLAILCSLCGILSGYFVPKCYVILFRRELNTTEHFQSSIQNYTKKRSSD